MSSIKSNFPRVGVPVPQGPRRKDTTQTVDAASADYFKPPKRRGFQTLPTPEVLEQLIERAVAALKKGILWDRGSILNLVV